MSEPMSGMAKQIFEPAALTMETQRISLMLGRQQMALEFSRCKSMAEVAELCRKEIPA